MVKFKLTLSIKFKFYFIYLFNVILSLERSSACTMLYEDYHA